MVRKTRGSRDGAVLGGVVDKARRRANDVDSSERRTGTVSDIAGKGGF